MLKKLALFWITLVFSVFGVVGVGYMDSSIFIRGDDGFGSRTTDADDVITSDDISVSDGIESAVGRDGDDSEVSWIEVERDFEEYVRDFLNYFLGLLFIVTFVYLLYHAFLSLTSPWDEEQMKKSIWAIKIAAFVLLGIALSWFIISQVFDMLWVPG